jgi:hypothetical protein
MRKLPSIAFAAAFAAAAFATPASAQSGSASGSCGPGGGVYGYHDINSNMVNQSTDNVPAFFVEVNYSGVPAPTTIGVIVRRNDELEDQVLVYGPFTAQNSGGTLHLFAGGGSGVSAIVEDGQPVGFRGPNGETEGFTGSTNPANHNNNAGNTFSPGANRAREGHIDGPRDGGIAPTGGTSPSSGVFPGDYVYYVYTGSVGDVYNVKDGTVARNAFIADEKGYLGKFSCGVSTDSGSGPG